jgi:hypothetical protein
MIDKNVRIHVFYKGYPKHLIEEYDLMFFLSISGKKNPERNLNV